MAEEVSQSLIETDEAVQRLANFDSSNLARRSELGDVMNFEEAVPHAKRLSNLFSRISYQTLSDLPQPQLDQIKYLAMEAYKVLEGIQKFTVGENPTLQRRALINQLADQYTSIFPVLAPWIAYSVAQTIDFNSLAEEGRAVVQRLREQADKVSNELRAVKTEADSVLEEVRRVAAEQGVTQQARYFSEEADHHKELGKKASRQTLMWSAGLAAYGVLALFVHKFPWLTPNSVAEAIQLFGAKLVLFFALAYMLLLSTRTLMAHRHNEVVNRHKQNALMTFNALVAAGGTPEAQNTILNHAAASIYQPQDSGYTRRNSEASTPASTNALLGMLLRPSQPE